MQNTAENSKMEGDETMDENPAADSKEKKFKTKTITIDLPIEETTTSPYSAAQIGALKEIEVSSLCNFLLFRSILMSDLYLFHFK